MSVFNTADKIKNVLQNYNDELHFRLEQTADVILLVKHDLTDPRKFTIVKDAHYGKLEGKTLIFNDPEEFKESFPEFSQPPPIHIPTNMKRNVETGNLEGIHKDPYQIKEFKTYPSDDVNGLKLVVDMGRDVEVGTLWLKFPFGKERITVATAKDVELVKFAYVDKYVNYESKGLTDEFEHFNIEDTVRYLLLIVYDNPKLTDLDMMNNIRVTKAKAII